MCPLAVKKEINAINYDRPPIPPILIPVLIKEEEILAFVDPESESSLIHSDLVKRLQLPLYFTKVSLKGIHGTYRTSYGTSQVQFELLEPHNLIFTAKFVVYVTAYPVILGRDILHDLGLLSEKVYSCILKAKRTFQTTT
ncbi:hypothetical protein GEMRC1_006415 [Eukaryota sp. GEM-RC1]